MTALVQTRDELAIARTALRGSVALVPTMGALHAGHRSLLRVARGVADNVVVSIFVNPLQFAPTEDLAHYPRTLEADVQMCDDEGVALIFAPSREQMYPREQVVRVAAGAMGEQYEGASRPGHFDGVLTVVAKLFELVRPDVAVFGRKDAQQLALIERMVTDLGLPVRIAAAPLIRDADGLALSSRNRYLSPADRQSALALSKALAAGSQAAAADRSPAEVVAAARAVLDQEAGLQTDYVALVDADTFEPLQTRMSGVLALAARVGSTRLIDNVHVTFDQRLTFDQPLTSDQPPPTGEVTA
jgi:pantoate--beta-alanine ligase